jgi:hypothetical protein
VTTGGATRVTDVAGGVTGPPVWSPDGRRIAFTAQVAAEPVVAGAPRVQLFGALRKLKRTVELVRWCGGL